MVKNSPSSCSLISKKWNFLIHTVRFLLLSHYLIKSDSFLCIEQILCPLAEANGVVAINWRTNVKLKKVTIGRSNMVDEDVKKCFRFGFEMDWELSTLLRFWKSNISIKLCRWTSYCSFSCQLVPWNGCIKEILAKSGMSKWFIGIF